LKHDKIAIIVQRNYVVQLSALENHVFLRFGPFLALIWHNLGQSGLKI